MLSKVFLSYRREDSTAYAIAVHDRFMRRWGADRVFWDIDSIRPGDDFGSTIDDTLAQCCVIVTLIGTRWLDVTDDTGRRRLDDPSDFHRLELERALERQVRIIPALVGGARMPRADQLPESLKALARRNAVDISDTRFNFDVERLARAVDAEIARTDASTSVLDSGQPARRDTATLGREPRSATKAGAKQRWILQPRRRHYWMSLAALGSVVVLTTLWYRAESPAPVPANTSSDQPVSTTGETTGGLAASAPASTAAQSMGQNSPAVESVPSSGPAAPYASETIRVVVPFAAGDTADVLGRALAEKLAKRIGQTIAVENRPGTRGKIGAEFAGHAPADGYTLLLATSTHAANVNLLKDVSFDPVKDFAPISLVATVPYLLVVHPSLPVKTVKELITSAKESPGSLSFASSGTASIAHLAGELLKIRAQIDMGHVPYKKFSAAVSDTLSAVGGTVAMFTIPQPALPYIARGKLRVLAVTSAKPSPILPEVPPVRDTVKSYEALLWYGLLAPAGTDESIIAGLHRHVVQVVESDDIRKQFESACEFVGSTPAQFERVIKADIAKWGGVVREAGIKLE
jgi:tripartite-type tricarboxylate transporter receptor subunit TctC